MLVLAGPEPDYRWPSLADAVSRRRAAARRRASGSASGRSRPRCRTPGPCRSSARRRARACCGATSGPGPPGILRVPAALVSASSRCRLDRPASPAVGYFAQVPHYVCGPYPPAAVELLVAVERHLGADVSIAASSSRRREQLRTRLDAATARGDNTRAYVERLESMVDEQRLPSGDDLISEIEQFLRDRGPRAASDALSDAAARVPARSS